MTKRYDVCSPRPRKDSDKPFWHRVGTAWQSDKGVSITFDSLPLPDKDGKVTVLLFEPRDDSRPQTMKAAARGGAQVKPRGSADPDDSIPFAAEFR